VTSSTIDRSREAYDAFVLWGDLSVFESMLDPDGERRAWNDEGNCHGRREAMAVIDGALESGAPILMPEFIGSGDTFVLVPDLGRLPSFFPEDAEGLSQVVETRHGKIIRIRDFIRRAEALANAGL
jgi:hypothetical protein